MRGRNYFPQDVEAAVEADPRARPGCTAAFQAWVPADAAGASASGGNGSSGVSGPGRPGSEGVVVATELRDTCLPPTEEGARAIVAALRSAVMRDLGLALSAVLLLRPHAARKTTSGKIARRWNQRAFAALVGAAPAGEPGVSQPDRIAAGQQAQEPKSPWVIGPGGNVVLLWLAPSTSALEAAELEESTSEGAVGAREAGAAGEASLPTVPTATSPRPASDPALLALTGPPLTGCLLGEVRTLLRDPSLSVSESSVTLTDLGLDSLLLTQLSGLLAAEYGFRQLRDEMLFAEYCSVDWLAAHAQELRGEVPLGETALVPLPSAVAQGGTVAPASGAHVGSNALGGGMQQPLEVEKLPGGAQGGPGAGPSGAGDVMEVGLNPRRHPHHAGRPGRSNKPSWFEANCPCCMFCW